MKPNVLLLYGRPTGEPQGMDPQASIDQRDRCAASLIFGNGMIEQFNDQTQRG